MVDDQELDDVKLKNDSEDGDVDDLINLPYLHEPAILYCLENRYNESDIYTYTGPILIAVNPFKKVPLYTAQILEMYYNLGLLKSQGIENASPLPPHVYAIADASYRDMMGVILNGMHSGGAAAAADQAILISGESGAGKTESTKIVLRYLTTVGSSSGAVDIQEGSIMDKVLQSNPILEAFGNAKTIRNDNSSRFGKFIELNFSRRGHLVGGTIRTYLLEKVRLPFQQLGERNFHIFYQMAAGGSLEERQKWRIESAEELYYVNQGGVFQLQWVDDHEEFEAMRTALRTLGFEADFQVSLLNVMAGLLHLGQLKFVSDADGEGSELAPDPAVTVSINAVAELCGVPVEELKKAITVRIIVARNETYEKKLTPEQASDARDALAKALYGKIFDWIVATINRSIQVEKKQVRADIAVLDIFGFECFKLNSFEQLCINYTNETLQQQFNQFIFKMEQAEYKKEKINWSFIEFPDNQDCLDLIEHKQTGIIAMLDDECRLPKATDEKFHARIVKSMDAHPRFTCTPQQKRGGDFCVNHYAGPVVYNTTTFIEKNKDEFPKEATTLCQDSTDPLIRHIFNPGNELQRPLNSKELPRTSSGRVVATSVGSQFREQLHSLMEKIHTTKPHYIRCLKPNDQNVADRFDRIRTTEQLRYGGVLEAVRVARSGFPVRLSHSDFYSRYRPLANPFSHVTLSLPRHLSAKNSKGEAMDPKDMCDKLLAVLWDASVPGIDDQEEVAKATRTKATRRSSRVDDMLAWKGKSSIAQESVQLGITKVFLRKVAHDILESRRSRRLVSAAKRIQSSFRGYLLRSWFIACVRAARLVQRVYRGSRGRYTANLIRLNTCAKRIQTAYRCYASSLRYSNFLYAVIALQSGLRGNRGRKEYYKVWFQAKGGKLKANMMMLRAKRRFLSFRRAVIALQCCARRSKAKVALKELRVAAKDVGRLQQSNEALKAEIEALRALAADQAKAAQAKAREEMVHKMEEEKANEMSRLQKELEETKAELEMERSRRKEAESKLQEAQSKNSGAGAKAAPVVHGMSAAEMEEYNSMRDELDREKIAREALEDEIIRLRQVNVDREATRSRATSSGDKGGAPRRRLSEASVGSNDRHSLERRHQEPINAKQLASVGAHPHHNNVHEPKDWDETWDDESDDSMSITSSDEYNSAKYRSKKSFSEIPMPQTYQRKLPSPENSMSASQKAVQARALIGTFEKNLEAFKSRMLQGIRVIVWEGVRVQNIEAVLKLGEDNVLTFSSPARRFTLFTTKIDVASIKISDIIECAQGVHYDTVKSAAPRDESCYLTIVSNPSRYMALMLDTRDDRNSLVTGLRSVTLPSCCIHVSICIDMLTNPPLHSVAH
jgi:myosin V